MENNQEPKQWIEKEQEQLPTATEYVKLPPVKFEENKIKKVVIDFSQPFQKWTDPESKKVKAIIPCVADGVESNWWLNILNPIYRELLQRGKAGEKEFMILQTGTQKKTKYILTK